VALTRLHKYRPGQWARRFALLRWTRVYPLANTTVAVVVGIPLAFAIESLGAELSWGAAAISVGLLCAALAAWALAIRQFTKWQRENGSVFYVSVQEGNDLDLDRVTHAIDSHPVDLFDGPLIKRNDAVGKHANAQQLIPTLERNTEALLKSGDPKSPMHLISNLRWDYAIGLGWCLPANGCNFVLWHLVTRPNNDFPDYARRPLRNDKPIELLGRCLVDVMNRSLLIETPVPIYPPIIEAMSPRPGLQPPTGQLNNTTETTTLAFAMPELPTEPPGGFDRLITWIDRPNQAKNGEDMDMDEDFNDPRNFGAIAVLVAEEIKLGIEHAKSNNQRLQLAARLPKPVTVAVGWLLQNTCQLTQQDMAIVDFGLFGGKDQPLRYEPLFFPPPDQESVLTAPAGVPR